MPDSSNNLPTWTMFPLASIASMTAELCTLPIDITKIRLQLQGERFRTLGTVAGLSSETFVQYRGMIHTAYRISKEEGILSLYKGASAALLRQFVYSGLRVGSYEPLRDRLHGAKDQSSPLWIKIVAGALTGMFAAAVATPTDLVKIRMQAEGKLAVGELPRYRGLLHAFQTIYQCEGIRALWKGLVPTVQRAMIINAAELSCYDHCKQLLVTHQIVNEDSFLSHLGASCLAGFVSTLFSYPCMSLCCVISFPYMDIIATLALEIQLIS